MPRSGAAARSRLSQAALDLYDEHGFDGTTTADIAARAGVTERTYFRHFADKREVLFHIEVEQQKELREALAAQPADLPPAAVVLAAFRSTVPRMEAERALVEQRHRIVASHASLRERGLTKVAALRDLVTEELRHRGLSSHLSELLAEATTSIMRHAIRTWAFDPTADLDEEMVRAFRDLRTLLDADLDDPPAASAST